MRTPDNRQDVKRIVIDLIYYTAGSFLYAVSVNCFSAPNTIAPGGVTGLATAVHYLIPQAPIGSMILMFNIPLLVAAWRRCGRVFAVRTLLCTVLVTTVIDVTVRWLPVYVGDLFLASVMGGVLSGVGLGLIFLRGGSTGGTEVAARLLEQRFPHISVGHLMLAVDAAVIAVAALIFRNAESAMYAAVLTFVTTTLIDTLVYGSMGGKLVLIFSEHRREIAQAILTTLNRGVTKLYSRGGFSETEGEVLVCAVGRTQVHGLRQLVAKLDPAAFMVITSAEEVLGKGFKNIAQK